MTNEKMTLVNEITNYFHKIDDTFRIAIGALESNYVVYIYCDHYNSIGFINTVMDFADVTIKTNNTKRYEEEYDCVVEIKADDYIDIGKKLNIISDISDEDKADIIALNIHDYITGFDTDTFTIEDGTKCHAIEFINIDIIQMQVIFQTLTAHVDNFRTISLDSNKTNIIIVFKKASEFVAFCEDYFKGFKWTF